MLQSITTKWLHKPRFASQAVAKNEIKIEHIGDDCFTQNN